MGRTWDCCRCCYSTGDLEKLNGSALEVYTLISNYQRAEPEDFQLFACLRCLKFLKEIHNFKIEPREVSKICNKVELILNNVLDNNSSKLNIKSEYVEINEVDIKMEVDSDLENLHETPEISTESPLFIKESNNCSPEIIDHKTNKTEHQTADRTFSCKLCSFTTNWRDSLKIHSLSKHSDCKQFSCDKCNYRSKYKNNLITHKKIHLTDREMCYKCSECSYTTTADRNLKAHVAFKHGDENLLSCNQCNYNTKRKDHLLVHIKSHLDDGEKPYQCSECPFRATSRRYLENHLSFKHSNEKPFACDQCDYRCKRKSSLSIHIKGHLNDCDKPYQCSECLFATTTMERLKKHFAYKHSDERPFTCDQCDYRGKTKDQISIHIRCHLNDSDKPYKCSECSYATTTTCALKSHTAAKHSDENPFSCDQCKYRFKTEPQLAIHKSTHLKDGNETFKCINCSYTTTAMWSLISHIAVKHTDKNQLACDQCDHRSKTKRGLSLHKKSHSIDKPYKCNECSYESINKKNLKHHIVFKHRDDKPFSCNQCNYRAKTKSRLSQHAKIHLNGCDKPYKCSECSYTAITNKNLNSHIAFKHSDVKPFSCNQCDYRCKLKSQLKRHFKIHLINQC